MYILTKDPINKYYKNENKIKGVILHVDLGTRKRTINHLKNTASASYHLYIPREGNEVIEFVEPQHGAWHAGRKNNPIEAVRRLFGSKSLNRTSYGICYEGAALDKYGKIDWNWNNVFGGQLANDNQIKKTAWLLKENGFDKLPIFAHCEATDWKPKCVLDFKERVIEALGSTESEQVILLKKQLSIYQNIVVILIEIISKLRKS